MIKHLLSIQDLSAAQINTVLKTADSFREVGTRTIKKVPTLRGRTVCNLFFEPSTRTRISFELAAKRLSADVVNFSGDAKSSLSKGESFKDTAQTLQAMGIDAIVVRHASAGAPQRLSGWVEASVINAGDGAHEHPTQALLDLYSIREHFPSFDGLRVGIVGDIVHSRVARSNARALRMMGAEVVLIAPPTFLPPAIDTWGVSVSYDLEAVLPSLDVVYLLRVQRERQNEQLVPSLREYAAFWGLDLRRVTRMRPEAVIMHPGPMNRGVEISAEVADLDRAIITDQVTNGVAVRMSLLYLMLGGLNADSQRPREAARRADPAQLAFEQAMPEVEPVLG